MLTASHAIRCMALTLLVSILGSCPALGDILPVRDIYDDKFLDSTWRHEYEGNNQIAATQRQLGPSVGGDGYLQTIIKGLTESLSLPTRHTITPCKLSMFLQRVALSVRSGGMYTSKPTLGAII